MKNFAITGVAGYIAPRHLQAIKSTNNKLVAALDPHDSVGILDRFTYDVSFFSEFERFDRFLEKLKRTNSQDKIDYLSICSPNYLHDAHIRLGFRVGADAICEKPLVLKPSNLDALEILQDEYHKKVYNILQLRVHPKIVELKKKYDGPQKTKHNIVLTYITSRGLWYKYSWKGNEEKSGGVETNIGVHFFDMLMWIFGKPQENLVFLRDENRASGFLELENANVRWYLSIDHNDLPEEALKLNQTTYRSILFDKEEIEFTDGFADLHTEIYKDILNGGGFGINDARPSIETVHQIRNSVLSKNKEFYHPILLKD